MDAIRRLFCIVAALVGRAARPLTGARTLAVSAFVVAVLLPSMAFAMSPEELANQARAHAKANPGPWLSGWYADRMASACAEFDPSAWRQFWVHDYNARFRHIEALRKRRKELAEGAKSTDAGEWLRVDRTLQHELAELRIGNEVHDAGVIACLGTAAPRPQRPEVAQAIDEARATIAGGDVATTTNSTRIGELSKEVAELEGRAAKLSLKVEPPPTLEVPNFNESVAAAVEPACRDYRHQQLLGDRFVKREAAMSCLEKANLHASEVDARVKAQARIISELRRRKDILLLAIASAPPPAAAPPVVEEKPKSPAASKGSKAPSKPPVKAAPPAPVKVAPPVFVAPAGSSDYVAVACPGGTVADGRICVRIPDGGTLDGLRNAFGRAYDVSAASVIKGNPSATIASFWSGGKRVAIDEGRLHGGDADTGFVARYADRKDGYLYASLSPRAVVTLFPKGTASQAPVAAPSAAAVPPPPPAAANGLPSGAPTAEPPVPIAASAAPGAPSASDAPPASAGSATPPPLVASAPPALSPSASPPLVKQTDEPAGLPPWAQVLVGAATILAAIAGTWFVRGQMEARRLAVIESDVRIATGQSVSELRRDADALRAKHELEQLGRPSVATAPVVAEDQGMSPAALEKSLEARSAKSIVTNDPFAAPPKGGAATAPKADATQVGQPPAPGIQPASVSASSHAMSRDGAGNGPSPAPAPDEGPPPTQGSPSQQLAAAAVIGSAPTEQMLQASAPVAPPVAEPPGAVASGPPSSANGKPPSSGRKRRGRRPGHGLTPTGNGNGSPQTV